MGPKFNPGKILFFFLLVFFFQFCAIASEAKSSEEENLAQITEHMKSLASGLEHMPNPPALGAIQIPLIDLKRSPEKKEEEH